MPDEWLPPMHWPFPTWAVRHRPFDFEIDEADVPVDARPPTPFPVQARLRLYLRPPAPIVPR